MGGSVNSSAGCYNALESLCYTVSAVALSAIYTAIERRAYALTRRLQEIEPEGQRIRGENNTTEVRTHEHLSMSHPAKNQSLARHLTQSGACHSTTSVCRDNIPPRARRRSPTTARGA